MMAISRTISHGDLRERLAKAVKGPVLGAGDPAYEEARRVFNAMIERRPEFEALYRANVAAVTAYFARRSADPQTVADLTADTFVQAITSFATFDPRKGTPRAWVFGIAP